MYKLPQGWVECELKDIFNTSSGGTPKRGNSAYYGGIIPWLKSGELNNGIITEAEEYITEEGLKNSSAKLFPRGSLLIALYGATVGKLGILNFDSATNQAICCIYQNKYYDRDFLFYYLLFKKEYLVNQGKGGAQPNISQEIIKALHIPVLPFNEQKRIVEKIEEEFTKIDEGIEKLKLAQEEIKQYKQSVLKSAFEGKLYKTSEWKEKKFEDICTYIQRGKSPKYSNIKNDNFIINQKCVRWDKLRVEFIKYVTDDFWNNLPQERFLQAGDILWNSTGTGTIGRAYLYNGDELLKTIVDSHVTIVRTSKNDIVSKFLFYFIMSPFVQYKIEAMQSGSTNQVELGSQEIKKTILNVPTLEEQIKIVKEIEKRFKIADKVEKVIMDNLEKARQLKQSILKKAFEGRLVPQDPNDEPASVLLEKIKAERGK